MQRNLTTRGGRWRSSWRRICGGCLLAILAGTASLTAAPLVEPDAESLAPTPGSARFADASAAPLQSLLNQLDSRLAPWRETRTAYQAAVSDLEDATTAYDAGEGDLTTLITTEQDFTTAELALLETTLPLLESTAATQRLRVETIMDIRTRARDRAFRIWRGVYALYLAEIGEISSEDEALAREHYLACRHRLEQALPLSAE